MGLNQLPGVFPEPLVALIVVRGRAETYRKGTSPRCYSLRAAVRTTKHEQPLFTFLPVGGFAEWDNRDPIRGVCLRDRVTCSLHSADLQLAEFLENLQPGQALRSATTLR